MRTGFGPLHLLFFTEAFAHHFIHRGLHKTCRNRLSLVIPLPVMRDQVPVVHNGLAMDTVLELIYYFSEKYAETEQIILKRLLESPFIHADETRINIQGRTYYVWVFTD